MTDIPDDFLQGDTDLTGTLKVGAAVRTIGASAFANTNLAGLDLSDATSLVSIGDNAFFNTDFEGTLVLPAKVTTISNSAFSNTQLNSLDISNAAALDSDSISGDLLIYRIGSVAVGQAWYRHGRPWTKKGKSEVERVLAHEVEPDAVQIWPIIAVRNCADRITTIHTFLLYRAV